MKDHDAILLLLACICAWSTASAQGLNERHPVSAEVVDLERQVMELAPDSTAKQRLAGHRDAWLRERAAQCAESSGDAGKQAVQRCAAGVDEDRVQSLRRTKLLMLIETVASPAPVELTQVRVAAAIDTGGATYGMGVTPNGARALILASQRLLVVDTLTGQTVRTTQTPRLENAHVSFFPKGRVATVTSRPIRGIRFFDTQTGELLREFPEAQGPHEVMPDGGRIAYSDEDRLFIYDVFANRPIAGPAAHNKEPIAQLAVSGDGMQIATLTSAGTLTLWRTVEADGGRSIGLSRIASVVTKIDQWGGARVVFTERGDAIWTASGNALEKWVMAKNAFLKEERLEVGKIQGRTMRRIPGGDVLVVSGFEERRGSYLLFYDSVRKAVAFTEVPRNYYPTIATTADGKLLFAAIVHELRRMDFPAVDDFSPSDVALAAVRPAAAPLVATVPAGPVLKSLPDSIHTEIVGVYEGGGQQTQGVQTSGGLRTARLVSIGIGRTERPLVLVLASYEPVIWELNQAKGSRLVHVLVSGAYESLVRGATKVTVTRIGNLYSYTYGDAQSQKLLELVKRYTGKGVDGYQGAYRGIRFSVGIGAPRESADAKPVLGPGPLQAGVSPLMADHQLTTRASTSQLPMDDRRFGELLYGLSAYTTEEDHLPLLVDAELNLVANRWLASKLVSSKVPVDAPARWENMTSELRGALEPVMKRHLAQRARALKSAGLDGAAPFLREYERLLNTAPSRPEMQFSDGSSSGGKEANNQRPDMQEIIASHQDPAVAKWRVLWPQLRAHAATLAALHYRVDADPALPGERKDSAKRAQEFLKGTEGRVLRRGEWQAMQSGRLAFTLAGMDRFVLPLGTEIGVDGAAPEFMTISQSGPAVVITHREGKGLAFRFFDARWERDLSRRLSSAELEKIDSALTARWVASKERWFAPFELPWDAYMSVARQLRTARQLQDVYRSFREESDKAMSGVWAKWDKPTR